MNRKFLNPKSLPDWSEYFTQVISASNRGETVYISGQVSVDREKNLVGKDDLQAQAMQTFRNLIEALRSAGTRADEIVKINIYIKNYKPEDASAISAAVNSYFPFENKPTATWVGVQSLSKEDFLIEVDAIAVKKH